MISRVPTEVLQEIQKEIQKALAANPELPVVFIRDRTNYSKYLDIEKELKYAADIYTARFIHFRSKSLEVMRLL